MAEGHVSLALLFPPLVLAIGAWSMWTLHDSSSAIQASKWRRISTILGLLVLSADVILSAAYVFYEFSVRNLRFSVFDTCSSIGALLCSIGLLAALSGKGLGTRLLILSGCFFGMLFWYLTIGPHGSSIVLLNS